MTPDLPAADAVLGVDAIRAWFPALDRMHGGHQVAYFDGPGGTQVPRLVVDRMADYLFHHNANTHWVYPSSEETDEAITNARQALADFLGAEANEIAVGQNMTSLAFHLGRALGRRWQGGDEIVVTEIDHHANIAPWQALAAERGIVLRWARLDLDRGALDLEQLASLIGPRTRLVAVNAASNAIGTITDVQRVCQLAREAGALSFVDAVAFAPHAVVDVKAIGCDFLSCSAYKFYGPHIGVLFARHELLASLDVPKLMPAPDTAPEKMETGTQSHESMVGAAAAVNFLASLGAGDTRRAQLCTTFAELHRRGDVHVQRLLAGLGAIDGLRIFGPPAGAPRIPTVVFTLEGTSTTDIAAGLAARGVFVSNGDFYASTIADRYDQVHDGFVRVGAACYTTAGEVDRLIEGVQALADSR
ncbi:MAG: cysteine desulfurase-like protein [Gemmatimonadaceae bacterium]|nr:cysteine desulfurase-like protein [Gemmatimonadaceae bacterium]